MKSNDLTIGDVARKAGVATSTLRYYEQIGLLPKVSRLNGRRVYSSDIFEKLATIRVAQKAGFSLKEMQFLLPNPVENDPLSARWQKMALQKISELEEMITEARAKQRLLKKGLACQCRDLASCDLIELSA